MQVNLIDNPLAAQEIRRQERASVDTTMSKSQRTIHRLLCLLVLSVVFEGITRKIAPQSLGILIFFAKDLTTIALLLMCLKSARNNEASRLLQVMGRFVLFLFPCIALTAFHDPLLAIFGTKQYALFATVAIAMCVAYIPNHYRQIFSLFRLIAISVVLTTCVAVAQNRLPGSHWLNLTTSGEDSSIFSAGGYMRVSSTFPFVAQYCFYLNALCYCLPAFFVFHNVLGLRGATVQLVFLLGMAIIGTFVTGSRSSVIGNASILAAAGLLSMVFVGMKSIIKLSALAGLGIVVLYGMQSQHPELFAAYHARVDGATDTSHAIEVERRVEDALLGWSHGSVHAPPSLLGYGLGVMSNGADKLSNYAFEWRNNPGSWTETDQATTFFEGGWYLIIVWDGFRLWVIGYSFAIVAKLRRMEYRILGCFIAGFILIIGVTGTLALQPPLSIWWWMAVGLITCLSHFDRERMAEPAAHSLA